MSQRVAITAAAGGFGRTVARAFAAQRGEVHVCDVDAAAVESAAAEGLHASVVDVADGEALERWIEKLDKTDRDYEHLLLEALWVYQTIDVFEPDLSPGRAATTRLSATVAQETE